jgi:hypothetical protein
MAAHDAAPPFVRFVGDHARIKLASAPLAGLMALCQRECLDPARAQAELLRKLRDFERRQTAETYGPGHLEAQP